MTLKNVAGNGAINKAWAAAITAPLADWLVGMLVDGLWNTYRIITPDSAHVAMVSLITGLVVFVVPNLTPKE